MSYFDHFAQQDITIFGAALSAKENKNSFNYIIKHLSFKQKDIDILEIGPGRGNLAVLFMDKGYLNYDVVEPNDTMRDDLKKKGVRCAKNYLIPGLDEADQSYDLIILFDVFEHLHNTPEAQLFISEVHRVLKENGYIVIACPDLRDWGFDFWNCDYTHSNPTSVRRVSELLLNADMVTTSWKYTYSCFEGIFGYIVSRLVKLLTTFVNGESIHSKLYKLRLTFLRQFIIIGQARKNSSNNFNDDTGCI